MKKADKKHTGRHVAWDPSHYQLIQAGNVLNAISDIDRLASEGAIEYSLFHIFICRDICERNDTLPRYEAVYQCNQTYYRVQKKHLEMAYRKLGRCEKARMWDILNDGTPYWVDRYCFTKMGQRDSKRRYESKLKEKD